MWKYGRALTRRASRRDLFCAAFVAFVMNTGAIAEPVQGIVAATTDPIAVRGGVLMVSLAAQRPGTNWPSTMTLVTQSGENIEAEIGWFEPTAPDLERQWTDDPRNIRLRPIASSDDSSRPHTGAPVLFARLPADGSGKLQFNREVLSPTWVDPEPAIEVVDPELRKLPIRSRRDMPDVSSPLEHWRWAVLADSMQMTAPPTDRFDRLNAMLAEHQAALWRVAIGRLRRADSRLAVRCEHYLTATATDRDERFAVWVSEPASLDLLLRSLLQFHRDNNEIAEEAEVWIEQQSALLMWPVSLYGDVVELAMVNRSDRAVTAELIWENANQPEQSLRVPPGVLSKVQINRPQPASRGIGIPAAETIEPQMLHVRVGNRGAGSFTFPPREITAKPPGVFVAALFPPLTLADIERARQSPLPLQYDTSLHVRRLGGKWELYFDCRRPERSAAETRAVMIQSATTIEDIRGVEAITILIGSDALSNEPAVVLSVPELGWWKQMRGRQTGTLQIHRQSYPDRWLCRAVLPESWLETLAADNVLLLGVVRTHDGSAAMETAPNRSVPWRIEPGQLRIDLSEWDDLPRYEE